MYGPGASWEVEIFTSQYGEAVWRLRNLQTWLLRHVAAVTALVFSLHLVQPEEEAEVQQLVVASAAMCAMADRLQRLDINAGRLSATPLLLSSWVQGLRKLQGLHLVTGTLEVTSSLAGLTALQEMSVDAAEMNMMSEAQLPPSLIKLFLDTGSSLPRQVSALTALQSLALLDMQATENASWEPLRALSCLTNLRLEACFTVPPCLCMLTSLQQLSLRHSGTPGDVAGIGALLAPLSGLTSLWLELEDLESPAELAQLTGLRQLLLCRGDAGDPEPGGEEAAASLPSGAWLSGLTHLAISLPALLASLDVLPAAASLQALSILRLLCADYGFFANHIEEWEFLVDWLASHPPLQTLNLVLQGSPRQEVLEAAIHLGRRRPALLVERTDEPEVGG